MKHFRLFRKHSIFLFAIGLFSFAPLKAAHHISDHVMIHKAECQNYVNYLFSEINEDIDKAIFAANIPCYADKDLKTLLSKNDVMFSGKPEAEHVRILISPTDTITKDTVIYTPFDYTVVNQFVFNRQVSPAGANPGIYSVALQYHHDKGQQVFVYVSYSDFVKNLDAEESGFLNSFLEAGLAINKDIPALSLDSATMAKYASHQLDLLDSIIFRATKQLQLKAYGTDSLARPLPNLDFITEIDIPLGFIMIYYLENQEDKVIFNKAGVGLLYYPLLNKTSLPEQPLFFNRFDECKQYLAQLNNRDVDRAFEFCQMTAVFQMHNSWYKPEYWKGGVH